MYKKINYIVAVFVLLTSISVQAQVTTQSPYSRYGLGNVRGSLLPQYRAMGGISTGVFKPNLSSNINMQNPASYPGITLTTLDMGMTGGFTTLKTNDQSENSFNSTLSHVALAFPLVQGKSALSFGLLPYTELGYQFRRANPISGDSVSSNYIFAGEGSLTKAYFGFGQQFGDHFRVGANIEYLFGNLQQSSASELQAFPSINVKDQTKNSIGGIGFSYGVQYDIPLGNKKSITLGYSGSSSSKINTRQTLVSTQYYRDGNGEEQAAFDTVSFVQNPSAKLNLPLVHNFGVSIQKDNQWMVGADYRTSKWSKLSIDAVNQGLQDSWGASVGAQITPDFSALNGYFNKIDYRVGLQYDKTYIREKDEDIKQMAVTFGFGFPLAPNRYSIYKLNLTTEIGKRGTITNGLIQENYVNFHLGFTLNDTWFRRFKFD